MIATEPLLFAGSSNPSLAYEITRALSLPLGNMSLEQFPDGETSVQILENVRGRDTFVIQSIALNPNFYLMELLIIIDALRRASAKNIVALLPYFGYCRQDRKDKARVPITAKLVANLLVEAGATRILAVDLHAGQLEGFFDIPVDHIHCYKLLVDAIKECYSSHNTIVVAPDIGSVKIARAFATLLDVDIAVIDKQRSDPHRVQMALIGNVTGMQVLIADDICSTGETLAQAAQLCREKGCASVIGAITHGLLVEQAVEKVQNSPLEVLFTTDTIPIAGRIGAMPKLRCISTGQLLARAIHSIVFNESIRALC